MNWFWEDDVEEKVDPDTLPADSKDLVALGELRSLNARMGQGLQQQQALNRNLQRVLKEGSGR